MIIIHFKSVVKKKYDFKIHNKKQVVPTGLLNNSASRFVERPVSDNDNSTLWACCQEKLAFLKQMV